ncbi:hypothetical protein DC31_03460 [Microbacterium sp. CH12i]|uniref:hypothetical protein n=1 Tax=Microbacterium sp. CH12i TaxID=1479651 RepID=UPI000460DAF0|nr:hypothetical protein [Microbacterium sp. CH12i]KDA05247.1 hypothetical protein DC31_03460 [Microbacterium sp. CH12i]
MFNYDLAEAWSADSLLAWFSAQRAVAEAIDALEDGGAALLPLVSESDWHAQGMRALHELIVDLKDRVAAESGQLHSRLWELEAMERL